MNKRIFLKTAASLSLLSVFNPFKALGKAPEPIIAQTWREEEFKLPDLPYTTEALEPNFDKLTMEIHHGKHHAAYVKNLNDALKNTPFEPMTLEEICAKVTDKFPKIRNNGGGHFNHSLFWTILKANGGGQPEGKLAEAINQAFGSFDKFKEQFANAGKDRFGSGWAWLIVDAKKQLKITSTPNQDNPLMSKIIKNKAELGTPILSLDVWEHAYYLKYQNKRADYINAFWNVVNWEEVAKRFTAVKS
ncbi:MAG: superoxide dismutase [Microscillaceae bacterium]|nr:superoxide dismutase [Microscillaceae bacterium]